MAPRASAAVCRQRRGGADLRDRVVPDAGAVRRLLIGIARRAARHVHGRHVPGQLSAAEVYLAAASSAQGLCPARSGDRGNRPAADVRAASGRTRLHGVGRLRNHRLSAPRHRRECLPAASDPGDGRHVAGRREMGADHADGRVVARVFLRRQYCRSRHGYVARRLLPAAPVRHEHGDVCGSDNQFRGCRARAPRGRENPSDSGRGGLPG